MGWFDFFLSNPKTDSTKKPQSVPSSDSSVRVTTPAKKKVVRIVSSPVKLSSLSNTNVKVKVIPTSETLFLVPYVGLKIICHSEIFEKVNEMTLFVLDCIYSHESIDAIKTATNLPNVIDDEITYLKDLKLIQGETEFVEVTYLGKYYCELRRILKPFSTGLDAYLNLHNGSIETVAPNQFVEQDNYSDAVIVNNDILKNKNSRNLLLNENYSNSKDIVVSLCSTAFDELNETVDSEVQEDITSAKKDVLDSLYTTIKQVSMEDIKYRLFELDYDASETSGAPIDIYAEIQECSVTPKYTHLDEYRNLLDSLNTISSYPELLSEKASGILQSYKEERDFNPLIARINKVINRPVNGVVDEGHVDKSKPIVHSKNKVEVIMPKLSGIRFTWSGTNRYEKISIPFDCLKPVEVGTLNNDQT